MSRKRHGALLFSVNAIVTGAFILAGLLVVEEVNEHAYENAIAEAREKANILLTRNLSIHYYMNSELKPSVFILTDPLRDKDYFEPSWMSSTYAVREIDRHFRENSAFSNYYYKEAAINARTPANEADPIERAFLERLNAGDGPEMVSGVREIGGEKFFVVMKKGETMGKDCLRCHSTPMAAPAGLVEFYGPWRSFQRHDGQVVSALSIRIPLSEAFHQADQVSADLKAVLLAILGLLLVTQIFITRRLVMGNRLLSAEIDERRLAEERLEQALEDKDMLIREVNHRTKNNLVVIQGLLSLQSLGHDDERAKGSLMEAGDRVRSMAMIYDRLQSAESVRDIDAAEYIRSLADMLFKGARTDSRVSMKCEVGDADIDIDTLVPLGLIINELFSNAFKHAFPGGRKGEIVFSLGCHGEVCTLVFSDNGVGLPEGIDMKSSRSLGMTIINALVKQIGGSLRFSGVHGGTRVEITFPPQIK